jgi:nucleoside-diphosphate-sugar epimerase
MKILLTGANGFLGKVIYKYLRPSHQLFTLGKRNCDFNFDLSLDKVAFETQFDLIIHAAGKAHQVARNLKEVNEFYQANVVGTSNLLMGLEKGNLPSHFVFISTVGVYGVQHGELINEDAPLLANDPYGHSKIQAESIVLNWCNLHQVKCTILRLPLIAASNPPGNLGAMINAIKNGFYFNVGGGKAKKSIVLAEDIAKYIIRAAESGGIYNLTDGYHPSFSEISYLIARQLGKKNVLNMPYLICRFLAFLGDWMGLNAPINTRKLDKMVSTLTFDDSKARCAFNWNPTSVLKGFTI